MNRFTLVMPLLFVFAAHAQRSAGRTSEFYSKYVGKYATNGFVVQVALHKGDLVLVVPGAPLQKMVLVANHKFKSDSFDNVLFSFTGENGKITRLLSHSEGNTTELQRVSDTADELDAADSFLGQVKATDHFTFLYNEVDSASITELAIRLEHDYDRILSDFGLTALPPMKVRVYPNKKIFHQGINFPNAPDELLATAFGKDDFRMTSPNSVNREDSSLLVKMVTHEFTHCVYLNIDYAPNNPRWLWEGVANFEAGWFVNPRDIAVVRSRTIPPLSMLQNGLEYELGYVIIEAIKELWGFQKVVELIRRRGDTLAVFKIKEEDFEKRIYEHIYTKYTDR